MHKPDKSFELRVERRWDAFQRRRDPAVDLVALKAQVERQLQALISEAQPYIRVGLPVLAQVISSKRFKSVWETSKSRGIVDLPARGCVETNLLGYPPLTPKSSRPIYGYLADDPFCDYELYGYGELAVQFKRGVLEHATFCVGDSLEGTQGGVEPRFYPSSPLSPSPYSAAGGIVPEILEIARISDCTEVFELQIEVPVRASDIEMVWYEHQPPAPYAPVDQVELQKILKRGNLVSQGR